MSFFTLKLSCPLQFIKLLGRYFETMKITLLPSNSSSNFGICKWIMDAADFTVCFFFFYQVGIFFFISLVSTFIEFYFIGEEVSLLPIYLFI